MMIERDVIEAPSGYRSREAGLFIAQLDTLSSYMARDLAGIGQAELEWQPSPGMNTIGMLLAHIAIVEVFWFQIGVRGIPSDTPSVLDIQDEDDGIPLARGGPPPALLAGKSLSYYQGLLDRARAFARQTATELNDGDIEAMRERTRRSGAREEFNVRWVLFHVLEHQAGHYGQILLLRHQYREATRLAGQTT